MGFIEAFKGAIGGSFADQWKDFYTVPAGLSATVGLVPAIPQSQNNGRGSNYKGNVNVITNGSLIVIPEGFGLVTLENGQITGFVTQAGGYQWSSVDVNSQSFLSGGELVESVIRQSWERFKFGGQPGAQQAAYFVNLKEIPDNKFGTQSQIYYDDAYLRAQVGLLARGAYTLKISDPILFIKAFVPAECINPNSGQAFDFADFNNKAAEQLFMDVVASLQEAFSLYTNNPDKVNRITRIQGDSVGFANSLSAAVEKGFHWQSDRGLSMAKAALFSIEYDKNTQKLISDVQKADALSGSRGNSFLQQSVARGIESAGSNEGGAGGGIGMAFMGMGMTAAGTIANGLQQDPSASNQAHVAPTTQTAPATDPYEELKKLKGLMDNGIITQDDFDAKKKQLLGL